MPYILHWSNLLLASPPCSIAGEAVSPLYPDTSYTHTPEHFSNFDGLQCAELSLPTRHFAGGDMLYLHFKA